MANPFAPGAAIDVREPLLGFDRAASRRRTLQGRALVMAVAFASVSLALLNTRPRAEPVSALDQSYPVLSLEREVATLRDESTTGWLTLTLEFLAAVLACLVALDARELLRAPAVAAEEVEGGKSAAAFQLTRGIAVAPSDGHSSCPTCPTSRASSRASVAARNQSQGQLSQASNGMDIDGGSP